jgi:GntR family transcriptional regulator of arabinose operon
MFSFRRSVIARIPLYQQVRAYFLDGIRNNLWSGGEALPSENQLAETLHVSRITIKYALNELVREGIVYRIQGKGTFLSPASQGEPLLFTADSTSGRLQRIGEGMPFIGYLAPRLHNEYMAALLNEIEQELIERNHFLIFSRTHENQEIEKKRLKSLKQRGVKGIIIFPVDGDIYNEEILRSSLDSYPLVVIDRYLRGLETNCVCSDNIAGAFQATEHLLALGHRHIAFISTRFQGTSSIEDRLAGYEKGLTLFKIPLRPEHQLVSLKVGDEKNRDLIKHFLTHNPEITGIVAVNTTIGAQIIEAAAGLGRKIPEDLSIVFFDKIEYAPFKPTYIKQSARNIAKEAVNLLFETIENPKKKQVKIELQTALVDGGSAAPPPKV